MLPKARLDGHVVVREIHPGGKTDPDWPAKLEHLSGLRLSATGELQPVEAER